MPSDSELFGAHLQSSASKDSSPLIYLTRGRTRSRKRGGAGPKTVERRGFGSKKEVRDIAEAAAAYRSLYENKQPYIDWLRGMAHDMLEETVKWIEENKMQYPEGKSPWRSAEDTGPLRIVSGTLLASLYGHAEPYRRAPFASGTHNYTPEFHDGQDFHVREFSEKPMAKKARLNIKFGTALPNARP